MKNTTLFKPLYLVEKMIEEIGTAITYVYDDLVFVEHSDVVLQFDPDEHECIHLFINEEVEKDVVDNTTAVWMQVAQQQGVKLVFSGTFGMEQIPGKEEISIRFG